MFYHCITIIQSTWHWSANGLYLEPHKSHHTSLGSYLPCKEIFVCIQTRIRELFLRHCLVFQGARGSTWGGACVQCSLQAWEVSSGGQSWGRDYTICSLHHHSHERSRNPHWGQSSCERLGALWWNQEDAAGGGKRNRVMWWYWSMAYRILLFSCCSVNIRDSRMQYYNWFA